MDEKEDKQEMYIMYRTSYKTVFQFIVIRCNMIRMI